MPSVPPLNQTAVSSSVMAKPSPENLLMAASEVHAQGRMTRFSEPDLKSNPHKKIKVVK